MDMENILSGISLDKDVDGFHPLKVGNLALRSWKPVIVSCAIIWIYLMECTARERKLLVNPTMFWCIFE